MYPPLYEDYIGGVPDEVSPDDYAYYFQQYAVAGVWAEVQAVFDEKLAEWEAEHE